MWTSKTVVKRLAMEEYFKPWSEKPSTTQSNDNNDEYWEIYEAWENDVYDG